MQIWKQFSSAAVGPRCQSINGRDRERLFFLLHQMLRTGQPAENSLRVVARAFKSEKKEDINAALNGIAQKVAQGKPFSRAAEQENVIFSDIHRAAIMAGEASNNMTDSFSVLHQLEAKKLQDRQSGLAEIITPTILFLMSFASLFNTGANTLPVMSRTLTAQGKEVPLLPSSIMSVTSTIADFWYLIAAILLAGSVFAYTLFKSASGRFWLDSYMLTVPALGKFIAYKTYASMLLYFPNLLASGVKPKQMIPIMEALATNAVLRRRIDQFNQVITNGGQMSAAMERSGFPAIAVTPVKVAEHYAGGKNDVNDVMIDGMNHAYSVLERELNDANVRFVTTFSTIMWFLGGGMLLLEMLSIVLSQG